MILLAAAVAALPLLPAATSSPEPPSGVAERLRLRIEQAAAGEAIAVGDEPVRAAVALPRFYADRGFRPAWSRDGYLQPQAGQLLDSLDRAGDEGLRPGDYHREVIQDLLGQAPTGESAFPEGLLVDLDLLLTDAFLTYGAHLVGGRVNPETFDPEWVAVRREVDLQSLLEDGLDPPRIAKVLGSLLPEEPGFRTLRDALRRYREIERTGGWRPVPDGPAIKPGEASDRLVTLRARLAATGDLEPGDDAPPSVLDGNLAEAVRRFQHRNGLDPDGVVGRKTVQALNVPVETRIRQIEMNLERWRWLPRDLGDRYVLVNIPEFRLTVVEGGEVALAMAVIVGRSYRRTPVFSDEIQYLVFNPYWEVPHKLAVQDKLPLIKRDPGYLREEGIRVFQGWGAGQREIDPFQVDWSIVSARSFPYRLRQDPGPRNALGRIKFMFPNSFNVYLHDTTARELFAKVQRDLSSGCIRLEKPVELAAYLLGDDPAWNRAAILAALDSAQTRTLMLRRKVPVHLQYWTAWADENGWIEFREDLYQRDAKLEAALKLPPPGPAGPR